MNSSPLLTTTWESSFFDVLLHVTCQMMTLLCVTDYLPSMCYWKSSHLITPFSRICTICFVFGVVIQQDSSSKNWPMAESISDKCRVREHRGLEHSAFRRMCAVMMQDGGLHFLTNLGNRRRDPAISHENMRPKQFVSRSRLVTIT